MTVDPAAVFAERAGRHERMFWLDGGGSRPWSGRRSILGFLDDDDVSLTYDAAAREVRRHQRGRSSRRRRRHLRRARGRGRPRRRRPGRVLGRLLRLRLPPGPAGPPRGATSPTRSGCGSATPSSSSTSRPAADAPPGRAPASAGAVDTPAWYADGFAAVQDELRRGNCYEVNLTYRERLALHDRPGHGVPPAAGRQPRAVRRLPPARRRRAAQLEPRALRHRRPAPLGGDQADQGHHPARRTSDAEDAARARPAGQPTRSSAPRT